MIEEILVLSYIYRSQGITSTSLTLKAAIWMKNTTVNDDNTYIGVKVCYM